VSSPFLLFALPTLASSILQSSGGSINTIWIGHLNGETALAATSKAKLIMFLLLAGVFGFGMAGTIIVGQAIGRGDPDAARRAIGGGAPFSSWPLHSSQLSAGSQRVFRPHLSRDERAFGQNRLVAAAIQGRLQV
jgi:hypothetical protein